MSNAQQNAARLRRWFDPTQRGADPAGVNYSTSAFVIALADGRPIKLPRGTFKLTALSKSLAAGEDLVIEGEGPEATRLLFDSGHGLTISYDGDGTSFGDKTSIIVKGLSIETTGAGAGDGLRIINTEQAVANDTEADVRIRDVSFSGSESADYWTNAIYCENVAFPDIEGVKVEDGQRRTVAVYLNTAGSTYSAVDTTIRDLKVWEVLAGVKVRGKCEGVYLSQFVAIGCTTGVDWVATIVAGAKKPLLLMDGCHINTRGTAVATTDVAQIIASNSLLYITNSSTTASYGFDFAATSALSSENSRIDGVTIIGQGDRTASLAVGVRCGADVFGVTVDATIDNVGTCVSSVDTNRTQITPGSRLTNYNTRSVGFYNVASTAGGSTGGVSVDASLQLEINGADVYDRDMYREQLRVGSYVHTAGGVDETVSVTLTRPFRTDTLNLVCCWGADHSGVLLFAVLASCTLDTLVFRCEGMTPAADYRINYIAYGY